MRAVIDTNVLVSGLFWSGPPHVLLHRVRNGVVTLLSSPALFAELTEVIGRRKFKSVLARSATSPDAVLAELRELSELLDPPPLPGRASQDADDDVVLALAIAARADLIISGDDDLLVLGTYEGIPIMTPAQAIAFLGDEEQR